MVSRSQNPLFVWVKGSAEERRAGRLCPARSLPVMSKAGMGLGETAPNSGRERQ